MKTTRTFALLAALLLFACAKRAAPPLPGDSVSADAAVSLAAPKLSVGGASPRPAEPLGAIEARVFPVDLVMEHQADIALDSAQRDAITKEVARAQADLVKLQFDLEAEKEKLVKVLDGAKVDEAKSKDAAAALMAKENAIKAAHLAMLVRIKNVLTAEQQQKLKALREDPRCEPRDGG
jgi:Spy/CpxP family protein refolding chaperone